MTKVAFIISSLDLGGAQRAVSNITLGLPKDWNIDIILNNDTNIVYPYRGNIISLGVEDVEDRTNLLFQARVFIKRIHTVKRLRRKNRYAAVVSFLDSANVVNILTGNVCGKTIISVRNNLSQDKSWKYKYIVSTLVRQLYNRADLIVSVSEGVRQDLIANYSIRPEIIKTIYNGCDLNKIADLAKGKQEITVDKQYVNYVTVGRLTHQKGQWHLIRAFSDLYKKEKNVRLYILGDGELKSYYEKLIFDCNLKDVVYLCGFVSNPYAVIKQMDVFVLPSLYEGFPNALLEAMACGLPCIASDFKSGAREILLENPRLNEERLDIKQNDYGIIVSDMSEEHYGAADEMDDSEEELADAMFTLAKDCELRREYADSARRRVRRFSLDTAASMWASIIQGEPCEKAKEWI